MLRLNPTIIPLTRGEILQYEMRAKKRKQIRELLDQDDQNYVTHGGPSPDLDIDRLRPRIRRGPERRPKYYSNTPFSASSSFSTVVNDDGTTLEKTLLSNHTQGRSSLRRDSVLSSEGTGVTGVTGRSGSAEAPQSRKRYAMNDSWINDALSTLRISDEDPLADPAQTCSRRPHCRSASDPNYSIMHSACTPRLGLHSSRQRSRTVSSASATDQARALADIDEADKSESIKGRPCTAGLFNSRTQHDTDFAGATRNTTARHGGSACSLAGREELSALSNAASNSSSPLDELVEDVAALRQAPWDATLPARPRVRSTRLVRFPTFSDEDELANTSTPQHRVEPSVLRVDHAQGPRSNPPEVASYETPRSRLQTYSITTRMAPVATPRSRTPASNGQPQENRIHTQYRTTYHRGSAIRRRPVPRAEQENEELVPFVAERTAWLARQNEPYRGRLDRTPSPGGDLGRRLS